MTEYKKTNKQADIGSRSLRSQLVLYKTRRVYEDEAGQEFVKYEGKWQTLDALKEQGKLIYVGED